MDTLRKIYGVIGIILSLAFLVFVGLLGYWYYQLAKVQDILEIPPVTVMMPQKEGLETSTNATSTPAAPLITP